MARISLVLPFALLGVLLCALTLAPSAPAVEKPTGPTCKTTIVNRRSKEARKTTCAKSKASKAKPTPKKPASVIASAEVYLTTSNRAFALTRRPDLTMASSAPRGLPVIQVNENKRYQRFTGIGAAMTDSSAWLVWDELPKVKRAALLSDLFGSSGIHLGFLRVQMGASDFTVGGVPYSYDDMPAGQSDPTLANFSIAHDLPYVIPSIRQALKDNPSLAVLANPWSPPAWMKANDSLDNINGLGALLPSAYGPLAQYFVKFVESYAARGIPIDAITPQNEPNYPPWPGVSYPGTTLLPDDEATFISKYLAPAFAAAGIHLKIYGNDLSWISAPYARAVAASPAASDLAGLSWHCYGGSPTTMSQFHAQYPSMDQIVDECSPEIRPLNTAETVISSLRNWAGAVAVWNIALDPQGGPVQPPNSGCSGCTGVVTVSEAAHAVGFNLKYYQLGQVSKFVQPGAYRIASNNFVSYSSVASAGLDDVAFQNPDGSKALIAYNNSTEPRSFAVKADRRYFNYSLPAHAMATFVWDRPA